MKQRVVLGFLGTNLDMGFGPERWERWRPTVSICAKEDSTVARFELLYEARYQKLADQVMEDLPESHGLVAEIF